MTDPDLDELIAALRAGNAVLFTGAGFSADARDRDGEPMPVTRTMTDELRGLCFGDCDDDSTLQDLYDVAAQDHRAPLIDYLQRRLRVGSAPLPDHYGVWLSAPWARVYTLNVDDLEREVARQFELPRPPFAVSAVPCKPDEERRRAPDDALEIVHLNGIVTDDLESVTFSTLQYATRLVDRCPYYAALIADMDRLPFVFVGTQLDESLFWQHLQLRRGNQGERERPTSYLITPRVSRARQILLERLQIQWIPETAEGFADGVLRSLVAPPRRLRRAG